MEYQEPEIKIIYFTKEDVILASGKPGDNILPWDDV